MKIAELLQSLSDSQVHYVLVGGMAVQLHCFLRATLDIDLVLAMNDENLVRFIDVAKSCGLTPGIPVPIDSLRNADQIAQWHREKGMLTFSLREPHAGGGMVDVLVRPEVTFERLFANAVEGKLFGRRVPIASIDDLLPMARINDRPKDRLDIEALERFCAKKIRMNETKPRERASISETLMLASLAQSEQMREFFVEMWLQNAAIARQAGARVQALLAPLGALAPAPTR